MARNEAADAEPRHVSRVVRKQDAALLPVHGRGLEAEAFVRTPLVKRHHLDAEHVALDLVLPVLDLELQIARALERNAGRAFVHGEEPCAGVAAPLHVEAHGVLRLVADAGVFRPGVIAFPCGRIVQLREGDDLALGKEAEGVEHRDAGARNALAVERP